MKMWKNGAFALCSALVLGGSVLALASCNAGGAEKEKEIASTTKVINNYTNNFYGNASEVDISQG